MKPLHDLPEDIWANIDREIAPSAVALTAIVKFYAEATGGDILGGNHPMAQAQHQPPHIRLALKAMTDLFKFMIDQDREISQPNEDPLHPSEITHLPPNLHREDPESIVAYAVRYLPEEAKVSHNRWIKHQLGFDPIHEQITQDGEHICQTMDFYHEVEDGAPHALICACYREGKAGTEQSHEKAFNWALKAAQAGHPELKFNVGITHFHGGAGATQDKEKAVHWFRKAAD